MPLPPLAVPAAFTNMEAMANDPVASVVMEAVMEYGSLVVGRSAPSVTLLTEPRDVPCTVAWRSARTECFSDFMTPV